MRTNLQILAVIITLFISSSLIAQEAINRSFKNPGRKSYHNLDSVMLKQDLNITSIVPVKPDTAFPFHSHLSARLLNKHKEIAIEQSDADFTHHYNMPIAKPKTSSKILIAKFDSNFPYSYNMPVKKTGGAEK